MNLVDSHAHLDDPRFADDLAAVIGRAEQAGVNRIMTVGCLGADAEARDRVLRLLDDWPSLRAAFGVHPHDARFMDDSLEGEIDRLMADPRVLGIGEIGLDFYYDNSPRDAQAEAFARQLALARRHHKPVVIHTRDAESETIEILSSEPDLPRADRGVLHCFTGSEELARAGLELGYSLSFGGVLTFKKAEELRAIAGWVPGDRILLETDCPYLAPVPHRGKRNEPAYVAKVAEVMAACRNSPAEKVASQAAANFQRLFETPQA